MAKINRLNKNANESSFSKDALFQERTVFDELTDSDTLNDNINSQFSTGFGIYDENNFPNIQDFNGFSFTLNELTAYLYQVGLADWSINQEYHLNSIISFNREIYISQIDDNIGNQPDGGGIVEYSLSSEHTVSPDYAEVTVSLGNNFYVYNEDGGDYLILLEFIPSTNTYVEISKQDISSSGYNPENSNSSSMSQSCRLSDNLFNIVGRGTGFSDRIVYAYHIDTVTGLFTLKDTISRTGGSGAGSPIRLDEMANASGETKLKFISSNNQVGARLYEYDTVLESLSDLGVISFSGDSGVLLSYNGACVLDYEQNKVAVIFGDGGPLSPNSGGIGIYELSGTVLTNITGSWNNSILVSFISTVLKRFSDNKIMSVDRGSIGQSVKTHRLDQDGITFIFESSTSILNATSNDIRSLVSVNNNKSFMISNRVEKTLQTYDSDTVFGAWKTLDSKDLSFDGNGTSLTSNNVNDALVEVLVDKIYPVGSLYYSMEITEPSSKLGFGVWVKSEGRMIIGVDGSDAIIDTALKVGGNRTIVIDGHALTIDELPPHTHTVGNDPGSTDAPGNFIRSENQVTGSAISNFTGGNAEHAHTLAGDIDSSTLPPFFAIHTWYRVS